MALLSKQELERLSEPSGEYCVSIYMPAHPAGPDIRQDPIRFKNLLKQAQERLVAAGLSEHEAEQYVQPAYDLDRTDFWRHQQNGLAVFIGNNFLRYYRVPLPLEERVVASHQFHLKPLLPLLTQDTRFYILALSQKQVRLLEATRERANEIDLTNVAEVPQSLVDLLQYEVPERQVEHSSTGSAKQAGQLSHHGHGASWRDKKDEIRRFCDRLAWEHQAFDKQQAADCATDAVGRREAIPIAGTKLQRAATQSKTTTTKPQLGLQPAALPKAFVSAAMRCLQ